MGIRAESLPSLVHGVVTYPEAPPSARAPSAISNSYGSSKATAKYRYGEQTFPAPPGLDRAVPAGERDFFRWGCRPADRARVLPLPGPADPPPMPKPAKWAAGARGGLRAISCGRCSGTCSAGPRVAIRPLAAVRSRTCWPASCWRDRHRRNPGDRPARPGRARLAIHPAVADQSGRHADDARRPRRSRLRDKEHLCRVFADATAAARWKRCGWPGFDRALNLVARSNYSIGKTAGLWASPAAFTSRESSGSLWPIAAGAPATAIATARHRRWHGCS